jgi:Tir chaperone protein (CesT) family
MKTFRDDLVDRVHEELDVLGESLEVAFVLDDNGSCFFEHDEGWRLGVMLAAEDQVVAAISVLSQIEVPSAEALAKTLTDFNWLGGRTDGAALSWNPHSQSFLLWRSHDAATVTAAELNATLMRLVAAAGEVQPALMAQLAVSGAQAAAPEAAPRFGQRV